MGRLIKSTAYFHTSELLDNYFNLNSSQLKLQNVTCKYKNARRVFLALPGDVHQPVDTASVEQRPRELGVLLDDLV